MQGDTFNHTRFHYVGGMPKVFAIIACSETLAQWQKSSAGFAMFWDGLCITIFPTAWREQALSPSNEAWELSWMTRVWDFPSFHATSIAQMINISMSRHAHKTVCGLVIPAVTLWPLGWTELAGASFEGGFFPLPHRKEGVLILKWFLLLWRVTRHPEAFSGV